MNNRTQKEPALALRPSHNKTNIQGLACSLGCYVRLVPDLTISNSAGAGPGSVFGENLFWGHRTIQLINLHVMASLMLSATIKRQYSSMLPLLRHCLQVFDEIFGTAMNVSCK